LKGRPYIGPGYQKEEAEKTRQLFYTLERFEQHLAQCGIPSVEATTLEALQRFVFRDEDDDDGYLGPVFMFLDRPDLRGYVDQISAYKYYRRKTLLAVFKDMGEMKPAIKVLGKIGLSMAADLVAQGATPATRQALADRSGLSCETLTHLVQCCDLCRMTGMAGQALRRSLAMGYDSLPKLRSATPEQIRTDLKNYLAKTGERSNSMLDYGWFVAQAQHLPDMVQYT
jgi:hypothetical protein